MTGSLRPWDPSPATAHQGMASEAARTAGPVVEEGPHASIGTSPRRSFLWHPAVMVTILATLLYAPTLAQPFVQDDWIILYQLKTTPASETIAKAFSPATAGFYRPLGTLYFLLIFKLFGVDPIAPLVVHLVALFLHVANSLLVAWIIHRITGRRTLSASVAILYAASTTIHIDPLMWMAGFYDVAGAFFFFSSLALWLQARRSLSAGAFLLALLTKEACVALILVLVVHALLLRRPVQGLWRHATVLAVYISGRLFNFEFVNTARSNPYQVGFSPAVLFMNVLQLFQWILEAIFPQEFFSLRVLQDHVLGGCIVLFLVLLAFRRARADRNQLAACAPRLRQAAFLLCWGLLGLAPVLPLTQHAYRYYATYSLPPVIACVLMYAEAVFPRRLAAYRTLGLALFIVATVAVHWSKLNDQFLRPGSNFVNGSNNLIRKANTVRIVRGEMERRWPSVRRGATLVFAGVDVNAFGRDLGPRMWYEDTSLVVYTLSEYKNQPVRDEGGHSAAYFMTVRRGMVTHMESVEAGMSNASMSR